MKKIMLLALVLWLTGCQKEESPAPTEVEQGRVRNMLVLTHLYRMNRLMRSYEYAEGRLVKSYSFETLDKIYEYDDQLLQTKVIAGNRTTICQFNQKGVKLWKDEYLNNQFRSRINYQYRNKVFYGTETTPATTGTTDTRIIYKNPWEYQGFSVTIDANGHPGAPTPGYYYKWSTPFVMNWYEPNKTNLVSIHKFSPVIRKPDYYMDDIPFPGRLDQCASYRSLMYDWTEVPPDSEPDLLLMERKDFYAYSYDPLLYVVVKTENILLNDQGLPLEYSETGYWGPEKRNLGTVQYKFVYKKLE